MRLTLKILFLVLHSTIYLNGQTRTLIGRVIDESLEPLPQVIINDLNNDSLGTTDIEGRFMIIVPQETSKLVFAWIGMEPTTIKLQKDCDTIEVVMLYDGTYDFMSSKKVDRLRKKRFDELSNLHLSAFNKGLFTNNSICYENEFKPNKPALDSIGLVLKLKRQQIRKTFNQFSIGDTVRIPYSGRHGSDGTNRSELIYYSYVVDGNKFDCIIKGIIINKNRHRNGYNILYKVIDCSECHYDKFNWNDKEMKTGDLIEYNMKYFKIIDE